MSYALIDIGCLECGHDSSLIAVSGDLEELKTLDLEAERFPGFEWTDRFSWGGDGMIVIFDLTKPGAPILAYVRN